MKKIIFSLIVLMGFQYCGTHSQDELKSDQELVDIQKTSDDEEWDIIVFDPQYEQFLQTRAMSRSQYTESTLKTRNSILVSEWNSRVNQTNRNRDLYELFIQYNQQEAYGFEFEYKLYMFFVFVNWKYGENFNGLRKGINHY